MSETNTAAAAEEHVLDASGHFHTTDEPVDVSVYAFEDWFTFAVFWLLALDVFYQFFTRYVLDDSAAWTEEIARYLLIVVTFVGMAMGVRKNTHIHVEFVYRWLSPGAARAMSTLVDVVRIAFFAYGSWLAFELVPRMHNLKMTIVDFPMSYIYGIVAAGFVIATWRALQVALRHWKQGWSVLERPGEHETGA
jgi:TRAP-type C4-dicarboxylate transport system permease small subunit